jgi:hypothetical protein
MTHATFFSTASLRLHDASPHQSGAHGQESLHDSRFLLLSLSLLPARRKSSSAPRLPCEELERLTLPPSPQHFSCACTTRQSISARRSQGGKITRLTISEAPQLFPWAYHNPPVHISATSAVRRHYMAHPSAGSASFLLCLSQAASPYQRGAHGARNLHDARFRLFGDLSLEPITTRQPISASSNGRRAYMTHATFFSAASLRLQDARGKLCFE